MVREEACRLMVNDVRERLLAGDKGAALGRLLLFENMYLRKAEMPQNKVLLLKDDAGGVYVCDEYDPDDYGRVHVQGGTHFYATFNRDEMLLEYRKLTITVAEIVYEGDGWPPGVENPQSWTSVLEYFGIAI